MDNLNPIITKRNILLAICFIAAFLWVGAFFFEWFENDFRYMIILPLVAIVSGILGVASKDDSNQDSQSDSSSQTTSGPQRSTKYQDLLTIKELLDSGIITQEEYEEQKKQILGQ